MWCIEGIEKRREKIRKLYKISVLIRNKIPFFYHTNWLVTRRIKKQPKICKVSVLLPNELISICI